MVACITLFVVMLIIRIMFGYLSGTYESLVRSLPWLTAFTVLAGLAAVAVTVAIIVRMVKDKRAKRNKEGAEKKDNIQNSKQEAGSVEYGKVKNEAPRRKQGGRSKKQK